MLAGHECGPAAHVQQVAPLLQWTHCIVHCKSLAAKQKAGSPQLHVQTSHVRSECHQGTTAKLSLVWGSLPGDGVRAQTAASAH